MNNPFEQSPPAALTFEQVPAAMTHIFNKLDAIEKLLHTSSGSQQDSDIWFNLKELCEYLPDKPKEQTVYGWTHRGIIPFHKDLKKCRFLKSEIDLWLKSGRRKTQTEIAAEASLYIERKRHTNAKY